MNEEGLKLWEVVKLCTEGAYIRGDIFKNEYGQIITFYGDYIDLNEKTQLINSEFNYYGNQYEVRK